MTARILTIDIETSPNIVYSWGLFNQNISIDQVIEPTRMLSYAAKWYGDKDVLFCSEYHHSPEVLRSTLHELLDLADIVVHFNGKTFDIPHINRELWLGGYKAPSPYLQVDLLQTARKQFRFTSNKLDFILRTSGLGHKVGHTGFKLWKDCLAGDEKAWALMKKYNIGDTIKEEKLYTRLLDGGWIATHPNAALYVDDDEPRCPTCGSNKLAREGRATTTLGVYQRYSCKNGHWSRGKKAVRIAELRAIK